MDFKQSDDRITMEEIESYETKFDLKFPDDYKKFLLQHNVAIPNDEYQIIFSDLLKDELFVGVFLGHSEDPEFSFISWNEEYLVDMPDNTFIFALEDNDGMFIMITEGEDSGVYYWDNGYVFEQSSDDGNTYYLASTFSEFMELIKTEIKS